MRALVRASVKGCGLRVLEAAGPASALVIARREQPELALVDQGMADGDPDDVCRELRDDPETMGISIVTMGHDAPAGAGNWIRRPFSPLQLLHKLRAVSGIELGR